MILMHFKSINNNPGIFKLISLYSYISFNIVEGNYIFSYLEGKRYTQIKNYEPSGDNVSTYIEYFGCKLEGNDEIRIDFGENNLIILNKMLKKGRFNINLNLKDNLAYSDKNCSLLLSFREEVISPNITEESFNNSMTEIISYQYPQIEEDIHYNFYFHYEDSGRYRPDCSFY